MTRRRAPKRLPEQLLPGDMPADSALGRLLADASAPTQPHELAGLSAALTAFSASQPSPRRSPVKTVLASMLAAKALAIGAAVASIGGVALATATGSLPPAAQNAAHDWVHAPAAASAHSAALDESDPSSSATPSDTSSPSPSAAKSATPNPSLVGLCRAYGAGVATAKGKALDNPAFTVLITAAGGKDAVAAYCTGVLADAPGGKPTALPTPTNTHKPATQPTQPAHPTGAPSTHPTAAPSPHPTPTHPAN
jgi:hypothetical protein